MRVTYEQLENGSYDWSVMAYNFWPERVIKTACKDYSVAVAHKLDLDLWEQIEVQVGKSKKTKLVWQPKEMTESELYTYIQQKIAQG